MTVHDVAAALPPIPILRDRCRALAMLDAILEPAMEFRRYRYDTGWRPGEELAAMETGGGDEFSIVFCAEGVFIRGYDHESPMNWYDEGERWPGLVELVPPAFARYVTERSSGVAEGGPLAATVCLWREVADDRWRAGSVTPPSGGGVGADDGADYLFMHLVEWSPEDFLGWATDVYEIAADPVAVAQIFALRPVTARLISSVNPDRDLAELPAEIARIGYPADLPG